MTNEIQHNVEDFRFNYLKSSVGDFLLMRTVIVHQLKGGTKFERQDSSQVF